MKTTHSSARLGRLSKFRRPPAPRVLPFKVFIGYGDLPAVRAATAVIADALHSTRRRFDLEPMLWRFDQLASSHWQDVAVRAAQQADVIVLTSSEPSTLATAVESWVNAFLKANRGRPVTLVAVAGPSEAWTICIEEPAVAPASVPEAAMEPVAALV